MSFQVKAFRSTRAVTERKVVSQLKHTDKEAFFKLEVDARLQGYRLGMGQLLVAE